MSFDPRPYVKGITEANRREAAAIKERLRKARAEAQGLAARIMDADEEARAVYLFGSVAQGPPTSTDFDIDLALDGGDIYRAMDVTDESSFSVDLVDLHLLPAHFRDHILSEGRLLAKR